MRKKVNQVLIVYERQQRELENSLLLQTALKDIGVDCKVTQFYQPGGFNFFGFSSPKVIVVPHLYNSKSYYRILSRFGHASYIINMQYEQVLSTKWEKLGAHTPKGDAKKGIHVCWGQATASRLLDNGVSQENIKNLIPLHFDLLRPSFRNKNIKSDIGSDFYIDDKKHWALFVSSFTYADISDNRLKMNEEAAGVSLSDFPPIHTKSRNEILSWFRIALLGDKKRVFIYRPHPDELSLEPVLNLEREFDNFFVIRELPVKDWIASADSIYTWYSTSVVEAHFMDKSYCILRPFDLPDTFDSVLLKRGRFINTLDDFLSIYSKGGGMGKAIDDEYMNDYYQVDSSRLASVEMAEFVDSLIKGNTSIPKVTFSYNKLYFFSKLKSLLVLLVFVLYRFLSFIGFKRFNKKSFLGLILTEMDNQLCSKEELLVQGERVKEVYSKGISRSGINNVRI